MKSWLLPCMEPQELDCPSKRCLVTRQWVRSVFWSVAPFCAVGRETDQQLTLYVGWEEGLCCSLLFTRREVHQEVGHLPPLPRSCSGAFSFMAIPGLTLASLLFELHWDGNLLKCNRHRHLLPTFLLESTEHHLDLLMVTSFRCLDCLLVYCTIDSRSVRTKGSVISASFLQIAELFQLVCILLAHGCSSLDLSWSQTT